MTSTNIDICGICRDELVDDIKTLSCNHVFHTECIDSWTARVPSCPFCRVYLPEAVIDPVGDFITEMQLNGFTYDEISSSVESGVVPVDSMLRVVRELNIPSHLVVRLIEDRFLDVFGVEELYRDSLINGDDMSDMISRGLITDRRTIAWITAMLVFLQ